MRHASRTLAERYVELKKGLVFPWQFGHVSLSLFFSHAMYTYIPLVFVYIFDLEPVYVSPPSFKSKDTDKVRDTIVFRISRLFICIWTTSNQIACDPRAVKTNGGFYGGNLHLHLHHHINSTSSRYERTRILEKINAYLKNRPHA